jgi:putative flippase GtrA
MRRPANVYQRFRHLIHEGTKFGIIGGIGVIIVLAGSDALRFDLGLGKFKSVTIATIVATVFTFVGNRYWSFRHRQGGGAGSETLLFFVLNGVGLLIQYACIFLVTDVIGLSARIWYTAANMVGIGIGTLFRFWSYRKWIWISPEAALAKLRRGRHRKGRTPPVAPARPEQPVQTVPLVPSVPRVRHVQLTKLPVRQPAQRPPR